MPWLGVPYGMAELRQAFTQAFNVTGVPTCVLIDPRTGQIVCQDVRTAVMEDAHGESFPWGAVVSDADAASAPNGITFEGVKYARPYVNMHIVCVHARRWFGWSWVARWRNMTNCYDR